MLCNIERWGALTALRSESHSCSSLGTVLVCASMCAHRCWYVGIAIIYLPRYLADRYYYRVGLAYALGRKIELKYDTIPEEMATVPPIPTLAEPNVNHPLLSKSRYSIAYDKGLNPYMRRDAQSTSFPTWLIGTRNALGNTDEGIRFLGAFLSLSLSLRSGVLWAFLFLSLHVCVC